MKMQNYILVLGRWFPSRIPCVFMLCFQLALEAVIFLADMLSWINLQILGVGIFIISFEEQGIKWKHNQLESLDS